ncbi:hypothetical protein C8R44DRAFT_742467 [Mycena epipterygia]|nr:hypothetical protein C8R44DRAFT_742467 [Mycena epipterygia]
MPLSSFLFNPTARVYNFPLLILASLGMMILYANDVRIERSEGQPWWLRRDPRMLATCSVVICHHLFMILPLRFGMAMTADWIFTMAKISGKCVQFHLAMSLIIRCVQSGCIPVGPRIQHLIWLLIPFTASMTFRTATVLASPRRFWRQQFAFFGGCSPANPPYTVWRILLNRSLGRPLVSGVFVGLPIFAVYTVVVLPLNAQSFTRIIEDIIVDMTTSNPVIIMSSYWETTGTAQNFTLTVSAVSGGIQFDCSLSPGPDTYAISTIAICPTSWTVSQILITISPPSISPFVYITPGQRDVTNIIQRTDPIPLSANSDLLALLTWTQRQVFRDEPFRFSPAIPLRNLMTAEVNTIQTNQSPLTSTGNVSTLTLFQRETFATKILQEYTDTMAVAGSATFGGIWPSINGTFVLFFGANIVYFLFGRRPLSALGLVHIFQRSKLVDKWNEDFPALRTEGGTPGSESAGVVAFIRERLIDLEDMPSPAAPGFDGQESGSRRNVPQGDTDLQSTHEGPQNLRGQRRAAQGEYVLEEIQLMDLGVDLGLYETFHSQSAE